jgi:TIR domain
MGQKFFISFNSADRTKAHWIAWTLKEAGHEVGVHDWEIPAGGNVPLWMNTKLAWADRLIAVISPDYVPARYSPMEWASQIWDDPDGTRGSVIPVIVRPTSKMLALLKGLSQIAGPSQLSSMIWSKILLMTYEFFWCFAATIGRSSSSSTSGRW